MDTNTQKSIKQNYYVVDIFKFIFCIFVIAIHTNLLEHFPDNAQFYIEKSLFRLAVPFFFITSGFLLGNKIIYSNDPKRIIVSYSKRLLRILIIFEPLSILINLPIYYFKYKSIVIALLYTIRDILFYPKGALWFIQACIIGAWIIYFFFKGNKEKILVCLSILLYLFALISNSYYFIISNTPFAKVITGLLNIIVSTRNGIFVGVPLLYIGIIVARIHASENGTNYNQYKVISLITFFLFILELMFIKDKTMIDDGSLYVFMPIFIASLLLFILKFQTSNDGITQQFRNLSTGMYLLHSPINLIIYYAPLYTIKYEMSGELRFVITSVIAFTLCIISYKSKNKKINTLLK